LAVAVRVGAQVISWGDGIADVSHATVGGKWALRKGSDAVALPATDDIGPSLMADAAVRRCARTNSRPRRTPSARCRGVAATSFRHHLVPSPLTCVGGVALLSAQVMHMKDWALGSDGAWVSMGVPAVGDFGMGSGFFFSVPVVCTPGEYKRIGGVTLTPEVASALEASRVALAK
jgi:hypothetical protein